MAGAYCNYCGRRCFVLRVIPDGPHKGKSYHLATCQRGMEHDFEVTGYTHKTAVNPITDPDAAAAIGPPEGYRRQVHRTCGDPTCNDLDHLEVRQADQ